MYFYLLNLATLPIRALQDLAPTTLSWLISHQKSLVLWLKPYLFSSEPGTGYALSHPRAFAPAIPLLEMFSALLEFTDCDPSFRSQCPTNSLLFLVFYTLLAWCNFPSLTLWQTPIIHLFVWLCKYHVSFPINYKVRGQIYFCSLLCPLCLF